MSHKQISERVDAGASTQFEEPITVEWSGKTWGKITEHCRDLDRETAALFVEVSDRFATRLKLQTAEEAYSVLVELTKFGLSRPWMDGTRRMSVVRVREMVANALRERGFDVEQTRTEFDVTAPDALLPTCNNCGETYSSTTSGGPGETRRSCGCSTQPDLVADGGDADAA